MLYKNLKEADYELYRIIKLEEKQQNETLEFMETNNYCSTSTLEVNGSVLTNKYSSGGNLGNKHYGGTEYVDNIEKICKERALKLFKLDYNIWNVNVQSLTGYIANIAVYIGLAGKDGKIMKCKFIDNEYLFENEKETVENLLFKFITYKCNINEMINYHKFYEVIENFDPKIIVIEGNCNMNKLDYKVLRKISGSRYLMMNMSNISGIIAAELINSPFEYCDIVTSSTYNILRAPQCGMIFYKRNINGINIENLIESSVYPGLLGGPNNNLIGALAVALKQADTNEYHEYVSQILKNKNVLEFNLKQLGYKIINNDLDFYLVRICVEGLFSREFVCICQAVNISINEECIINNNLSNSFFLNFNTIAITTRGFKEPEMVITAKLINDVILYAKKIFEIGRHDFFELIKSNADFINLKNDVIKLTSTFKIPLFEL